MRSKPTLSLILLTLFLSLSITSCGQKGDLYLPAEKDRKSASESG